MRNGLLSPRAALLFGLLASVAAACGGDSAGPVSPPPPPPPPPNRAPTAVGTLPAVRVAVGESSEVQLAGGFNDPDGDALSYAAVTSNADVATVTVAGSVATVTGVAKGVATISVTATDPGGASARQVFEATVPNRAPETSGTIEAIELAVGETETLDVSQYFSEPDGDELSYAVASSDTTSVTAVASGNAVTVTAVAAGTATITVTATDTDAASAEQSFDVTVPNRAPQPTDTIPDQELAVGDSAVFELEDYFSDPDGDTLTYAPASSNEAVATATVSGSTLTVRALAKGSATISVTATDGGGLSISDSFDITVPNQAPVVTDTIPAQRLTVRGELAWSGSNHFADPDGDALTYAAGTTDAAIVLALVSGGDFGILGVSPGTATVTVTATDTDGLSASQSFQATVRPKGAVNITQVEPPVLIEGAPATIRGSGFSTIPGNNTVVIDGLTATVTAASSMSLSITVPSADCLPPRQTELRVTASGSSDARTVGVTPAREDDLALPAGWYRYTLSGDGCLHLPRSASGAEYLIGVMSTSEVPSSLSPVMMTSIPGDPAVAAEGSSGRAGLQALAPFELGGGRGLHATDRGAVPGLGQQPLEPTRNRRRHDSIMERNRSLARRLGRPDWLSRTADTRTDTVNYARGDTVTLYADYGRTCQQSGQVRAVVRLVGDMGIWLDDLANPTGTFADTELADFDAFLTRHTRPVHDSYFGRLSDVDANEKTLILMTREVNRIEGLGGWVSWADLYPVSQCATSNEAEITYLYVPDPEGTVGEVRTKEDLLDYYPLLLTHEITHLVQAGAEVFGSAGFKTSWENEGGATLAEQMVAYRLFGHGSNRDMGYLEYQAGSYWYWSAWVADMAAFFGWDWSGDRRGRIAGAPEECTWIGRASEGNDGPCVGSPEYGVSSMMLRFAMDRWGADYPGGEEALMRRLTQSPHRGLASLEDVSGWPIEAIMAEFYAMLWADGRIYNAYGMTSWNIYDIFSGFDASRQLLPWTSSQPAFQGSWNVRAGSSFYLHWTPRGGMPPTSLRVVSSAGGPVPDHISVWALRVR